MRGRVYVVKKEFDKALADLDRYIRLDSQNAYAYLFRAEAWLGKHEYHKAIADCTAAVQLDPTEFSAYELRAYAWAQQHEFEKVIADCTSAIRIDPRRTSAYSLRGWGWSSKREYDKAIKDYSDVIRLDPGNRDAYDSWVWNFRQQVGGAVSDATRDYLMRVELEWCGSDRQLKPLWVKDKQKVIADFSGTVPLEHANGVVFENLVLLSHGDPLATSTSLDPVPTPTGQNAKSATIATIDPVAVKDQRKDIDDFRDARLNRLTKWFPIMTFCQRPAMVRRPRLPSISCRRRRACAEASPTRPVIR